MKNTGLSLKEVSGLAGFGNEYQMNKCFQRVMKISPSDYARNYIMNNGLIDD